MMPIAEVEELYGSHRRKIINYLSKMPEDKHLELYFNDGIEYKEKYNNVWTVNDPEFFISIKAGKYTSDDLDKIFVSYLDKRYKNRSGSVW